MENDENEFHQQVGAQIERLLFETKRSVKDLAELLGMSRSNLYATMRGKQAVQIEDLPKIADFLGTTTDKLLARSETISKELEEQIDRIIDNKLKEREKIGE